jgi:hypothetical protein
MPSDPKAKYGITLVARQVPDQGRTFGKLIARVGLLEYLNLVPDAQPEVVFSQPFNKAGHTRKLYPGGPSISVSGSTGLVVSTGRLNSLRGGQRWTFVIGGKKYRVRTLDLRAEDIQEALKSASGINEGDYFISPQGGIYAWLTAGETPPPDEGPAQN